MLQNSLHFGAKRRLFWCKTQAVLVLNARRFGAKCKVKCCKTQDGMHKNTHRRGRQNPFEPLTKGLKRGKTDIKSGVLAAKSRNLGLRKRRIGKQLERLNGAKCRQFSQKKTKGGARKAAISC